MWVVFKKEVYRVFSDKKLFFTTFFLSPIIMIVIFLMMVLIGKFMAEKVDSNQPVVLLNNAPIFMQEIEGFDVTYTTDLLFEEVASEMKEKEFNLAIDFDGDFEVTIGSGNASKIRYLCDLSNDYNKKAFEKIETDYLEPYKQQVIIDRIGGSEKLNVFELEDLSSDYAVTDEKMKAGRMLGKFVPYMLFMVIFGSAMGLVMESVAGEKERGTLATQLLAPMPRARFALGKLFGLSFHAAFAAITSVLAFFLLLVAVKTFIPDNVFRMEVYYTWKDLFLMMAILVPTLLMNTSLLMVLSSLGRNIKEASNYVMPLYMLTIVLTIIPMNMPAGEVFPMWMYLTPVLGQACAMTDIMAFSADTGTFLPAVLVPLVIVTISIFIIRKLFDNEKMIVSE